MEPLLRAPLGFAHRGARAHAPENTLDAFRPGPALGATGLESDVWLTADGVAVLDHDGVVAAPGAAGPSPGCAADSCRPTSPPSPSCTTRCGADFELSLDVKDAGRGPRRLIAVAAEPLGPTPRPAVALPSRLGAGWPPGGRCPTTVKLVDSTRAAPDQEGPGAGPRTLADAGRRRHQHARRPTGRRGLTTLFHRFERAGLRLGRPVRPGLCVAAWQMGCDAVYSDHVDRMVDAR